MSTFLLIFVLFLPATLWFVTLGDAQSNDFEVIDAYESLLHSFGDQLFQLPNHYTGQKLSNWNVRSGINAEEVGSYPEGDILFPRRDFISSRNSLLAARRWRRGVVPYVLSGSFDRYETQLIEEAFADFDKHTCVRFKRRTTETDYLDISSDQTGCWSSVGKTGGAQKLNLQRSGCVSKKGTVVHELMHALGFLHEQNRWERDDYVSIKYQNIIPGTESNFAKTKPTQADGLGIEYDYGSVMHYSEYAFSSNGQPTIKARASGVQLGQREGLSRNDVKKIRRLYKCNKGKSYI